MLLAAEQTNVLASLLKETNSALSYFKVECSQACLWLTHPVQYLLCSHFLIKSDLISIYCIWVFQQPEAQWALCVCVLVPVGSPGTFSVYGFTVITFSPLNHRQRCVVVPPFPCPLTGHSLSVGYTVSSHTKVPLKYQFVYSSVLNMQCAVKVMSDSQAGKAESVLMALAAVIFSKILLLLQL